MGMALQVLGMQRSGMKLDPMDVARSILSIGQVGGLDGTYTTEIDTMYPSVGFQQLLLDGYADWKINLENRLLILLQDWCVSISTSGWLYDVNFAFLVVMRMQRRRSGGTGSQQRTPTDRQCSILQPRWASNASRLHCWIGTWM
jgi:hypothetical protein